MLNLKDLSLKDLHDDAVTYLTGASVGYQFVDTMETKPGQFCDISASVAGSTQMPGCSYALSIMGENAQGIFAKFDNKDNMQTSLANLTADAPSVIRQEYDDDYCLYVVMSTGGSVDKPEGDDSGDSGETTKRASISLKNQLNVAGTYDLAVRAYKYSADGDKITGAMSEWVTTTVVDVNFTKDNENVIIMKNGQEVSSIVSCGSSLIVTANIEGKMLPESIVVNGADFSYTRAVDNSSMGYVEINSINKTADGGYETVEFFFGELPDAEVSNGITFTINTTDSATGENIVLETITTTATTWRELKFSPEHGSMFGMSTSNHIAYYHNGTPKAIQATDNETGALININVDTNLIDGYAYKLGDKVSV